MEYDKNLLEIYWNLEKETKIFRDKYPTYFVVIQCENPITAVFFQDNYTGKLFSDFNKREPIGYIGKRKTAEDVRKSAETMMEQIKANTK